jgi:aminoglycoside/choline kinase family phosphotransferase
LDRDRENRNSALDWYISWIRGRNKDSLEKASRIWNTQRRSILSVLRRQPRQFMHSDSQAQVSSADEQWR